MVPVPLAILQSTASPIPVISRHVQPSQMLSVWRTTVVGAMQGSIRTERKSLKDVSKVERTRGGDAGKVGSIKSSYVRGLKQFFGHLMYTFVWFVY